MNGIDRLLRDVQEQIDVDRDAGQLDRQRRALIDRVARPAPSSRARPGRLLMGGTALALAAALGLVFVLDSAERPESPTPRAYWVGANEEPLELGAHVLASEHAPLPVRFEGGSRLTVRPRARVRVREATSRRVEVVLEDGVLEADIHRNGGLWVFAMGAYRVVVLGTAFELDWRPKVSRLAVRVIRGKVKVRGPGIDSEGLVLGPDQRWENRALPSEPPPIEPSTERPPVKGSVGHVASRRPKQQKRTASRRDARWEALFAERRYGEALAEIDENGRFLELLREASLDDLVKLADLSRYGRDAGKARAALTAIERRFPRSSSAKLVPFLRGRIALELDGEPAEAARWFARYARRQPRGPFADEARGRLIQAREQAGDTDGARVAAKRYLARHPRGPYAEAARRVLDLR